MSRIELSFTSKATTPVEFHTRIDGLENSGSLVLVVNQGTIRLAELTLKLTKRAQATWENSKRTCFRPVTVVGSIAEWLYDPNSRGMLVRELGDVKLATVLDARLSSVMPMLVAVAKRDKGVVEGTSMTHVEGTSANETRLEHSRIVASFGMRKVETPTDGRTLVDYFLPYNAMTAKVWFDHNTREWVAYLVDDDGNQIGYSVRERMFLLIAKRAMYMTENAYEFLYDSERYNGVVESERI